MVIKNDNGVRIKNCWKCPHLYMDIMGGNLGCIEGLHDTFEYRAIVHESGNIPIECRLPDWKRTIERVLLIGIGRGYVNGRRTNING